MARTEPDAHGRSAADSLPPAKVVTHFALPGGAVVVTLNAATYNRALSAASKVLRQQIGKN